jgi:hypothetical protein
MPPVARQTIRTRHFAIPRRVFDWLLFAFAFGFVAISAFVASSPVQVRGQPEIELVKAAGMNVK